MKKNFKDKSKKKKWQYNIAKNFEYQNLSRNAQKDEGDEEEPRKNTENCQRKTGL